MYKKDSAHRILEDYKVKVTGTKMEKRRRINSYHDWNIRNQIEEPFTLEDEIIQVIEAEIPEKEFIKMSDALCEMKDLMRDPETAKLLMEARFINRLKRGF